MVIGTYANALKKRNGVWIGRINRDTLDAFDMEFGRAMKTWKSKGDGAMWGISEMKISNKYCFYKHVSHEFTYYRFDYGNSQNKEYVIY